MNFSNQKKRKIEISLVPIINIIFLLVIFFIVTGNMKNYDVLEIYPPISSSGNEFSSNPLEILIDDEEIILNLELVDEKTLQKVISKVTAKYPYVEIMIKADAESEAKNLVHVMELIQQAGAKNIYLLTSSPL